MSNSRSSGTGQKSPLIAVVLAVVYPGLGHVYLRRWGRAFLWFVTIIGVIVWLVPASALPQTLSIDAIMRAQRNIPTHVALIALVLSALSVVDAYRIASNTGGNASEADDPTVPVGDDDADTQTCPNCGKELDADLDFCHWCTTEFDTGESDEEE